MPKFFDSFTVTGASAVGLPSAVVSGIGSGTSQAALAANKAVSLLSEKSGDRDSLLQALKALFDDHAKLDQSVLETFNEDVKGGLIASNDSLAFVVRNALQGVLSATGHVTQTPIDIGTVIKETGKGISNTQIPQDKMSDGSKRAFVFNENDKEFSIIMQSLLDFVSVQGGHTIKEVDKQINIPNNTHAETHARSAGSTSAGGSVTVTASIPSAGALLTQITGQIPREVSAIHHFSAHESESKADEHNVYHASTGVTNATKNGDSQESQQQSHHLDVALSDLNRVRALSADHSVSSPLVTALLRFIAISAFGVTARVINKTAVATTEGRLQRALRDATVQGPSGGVDRINSLNSNLSSLSNIMRLCAENLGGATVVKSAAKGSEVLSSRAISVLLSNVGELSDVLRQLVNPQHADGDNQASGITSNSPVDSAHPNVLARTEAKIKEALDRIEQANGRHVIPELNQDMASQLGAASHSSVATLVSTHSILTNPCILEHKASKEASNINDAQKNEALMESLPGMTQTLNQIQAFTRNLMDEMEKEMKSGKSDDGSLLSTHKSVASDTAVSYWAVSAISLLCDEMISICRSLTLIDQNRLQAASDKSTQVQSKEESAKSSEQMAWDSHSGQDYSATHAIPALRLTLSHTGMALIRIALDLHSALKDNLNTEQQNLAMHTLQRSLLSSCAHSSVYLAEGSLLATGGISASPVSSNGSINSTHRKVHSTDAQLHPEQSHSSEHSSRGISDSSQSTGFSTDLVGGTITNVLKVLAQGGLIGLDTILKLIKLLEIISLHRDSHIALQLESNDSSTPNGLLVNTLSGPSVGGSAGTGAVFMNILDAFQTLDKSSGTDSTLNAQNRLQDAIDQQIANLAILNDDEEVENKKGLKAFYKVIIRLLSPTAQDSDLDRMVNRLDFGGISLASYHTRFGAFRNYNNNNNNNNNNHNNNAVPDLRFVSRFANEDDAQGVLRRFIDASKEQFSLLKSLHDALPEDQRTEKAQTLYQHVFEEAYHHYAQIKMSEMSKHRATKRKMPTREEFNIDLGLVQVEPEVTEQEPKGLVI